MISITYLNYYVNSDIGKKTAMEDNWQLFRIPMKFLPQVEFRLMQVFLTEGPMISERQQTHDDLNITLPKKV
jgi:hypothetical protein